MAIRVSDVWIRYRTSYESNPTLRNAFMKFGRRDGRQKKVKIVEAVRNVSMDVPHGTVLGLIGANGAGKSTLMRAMAGILPPTEGRIIVNGRVSTLLALGVGFNPMLSGRENVILGGLAAGLSVEQVEEKFDEIAAFADLGDFIDMPMRTYSSGMYGRLGFSVSVNMNPDILLVDEALSTGDAAFKAKSIAKMRELVSEARTIVIVSHALGLMQELCNTAAWLHKGELIQTGEPIEVCEAYMKFLKVGETAITLEDL
jgi:ABC-type polysaccharide/polyol phosphate transport system ATPase subunit